MAVHHAVIKKAQKAGIILEDLGDEEERGTRYKAFYPKWNRILFGETASGVLEQMLHVKNGLEHYQSMVIEHLDDGVSVKVTIRGTDIDVSGVPSFAVPKAIKEWERSREDLSIEDEEADAEVEAETDAEVDGDDDRPGSVVSAKYRARYAEAGHPNNCGDWLRGILDNLCRNKEGTNIELFTEICAANGVDATKRKLEKSSDRGRYVMSGRNELSRVVWQNEELKMPDTVNGGESYRPPKEWLVDVQERFNYKKTVAHVAPKTPLKE
jgi:hypothetical protein